jgi:hypothetical protein
MGQKLLADFRILPGSEITSDARTLGPVPRSLRVTVTGTQEFVAAKRLFRLRVAAGTSDIARPVSLSFSSDHGAIVSRSSSGAIIEIPDDGHRCATVTVAATDAEPSLPDTTGQKMFELVKPSEVETT